MTLVAKNSAITDIELLAALQNAPGPVQAWDLQKQLQYSSGKLESALRRLENKQFLVRKKVTRVTENQEPRVITLVWNRPFEATDEIPVIERQVPVRVEVPVENPLGLDLVRWFEILDPVENPTNPDEIIIPVKLTKFEASLLQAIPAVNLKFANLVDFLQKAVKSLLGRQTDKVKLAAVNHLVTQGTITHEYGEYLLHGNNPRGDTQGMGDDLGGNAYE